MALDTEKDYQKKIDDLWKEIEKLMDEAEDKGFDVDYRANGINPKEVAECQKEYERLKALVYKSDSRLEDYHSEIVALKDKLNKLFDKVDKEEEINQKLTHEAAQYFDDAKKKGIKLKERKRGEDMTFEERKQIAIKSLETRALNTEKDYQTEINDWIEQVEDRLEKVKDAEKSAKYWKNEAIQDYKSAEKLYKEGTKKGFKLKIKTFKF